VEQVAGQNLDYREDAILEDDCKMTYYAFEGFHGFGRIRKSWYTPIAALHSGQHLPDSSPIEILERWDK
jgi:hypothetical protein